MRNTIILVILFFIFGNIFLTAQNTTGTISGRTIDNAGTVLPNVRLTLFDIDHGGQRTMQSSDDGAFQFSGLLPGTYNLKAELKSFKRYDRTEIKLSAGQNLVANFEMQIAGAVDYVGLFSDPPTLQTDDAKITRMYAEKELRDTPILTDSSDQRSLPKSEKIVWLNSNAAVYGQRPVNNGQYLDGVYFADEFSGGASLLISKEAVQETEFLLHNAVAEYGRNTGGMEHIASKAATQFPHGSVYQYHNNSALAARNFFENTKATNHTNVAGFTFGSAIKRDKVFIFTNYEINRGRGTAPVYFQGLTESERAQAVPAVKTLVDLYPKIPASSARQFSLNTPGIFNGSSFLTRSDVLITDRNHLAMHILRSATQQQQSGAGNLLQRKAEIERQHWSAMVQDTYTLNPTMINEFQLGYSRLVAAPPSRDLGNVIIGNPRYFNAIGLLRVNGLNSVGTPISFAENRTQNIYQLVENFSWIIANHALKFGISIHKTQINEQSYDNTSAGQLTFLSIPDFLAGKPASFAKNDGYSYVGLRRNTWQGFAQDTWRITPRRTLIYGFMDGVLRLEQLRVKGTIALPRNI